MRRHLILRGVDRPLITRLRDRALPLGLSTGELARALLTEQLGARAAPVKRVKRVKRGIRRKPFKA